MIYHFRLFFPTSVGESLRVMGVLMILCISNSAKRCHIWLISSNHTVRRIFCSRPLGPTSKLEFALKILVSRLKD